MLESPTRVGIFGGTFDPVHNGHVAVAQSFLKSKKIQELWILLNPAPPHKIDEEFAPYAYRLKMLQEAFRETAHAKVSDIETRLPKPCYTDQTISYLTESHPNISFFLCLGEDSFHSFTEWHHWREIIDHCSLLVANRPGSTVHQSNKKLAAHADFVDHEPIEVSSSQVRERIVRGESIDALVPPAVLEVIKKNKLYQ